VALALGIFAGQSMGFEPPATAPMTAPATSPAEPAGSGPANEHAEKPDAYSGIDLSKLPPWVKLGVSSIRQRDRVEAGPGVVIVNDGVSYLEAIAVWTPTRQFPVLIDDGSAESREDIARFVRAYWEGKGGDRGGAKVYRWTAEHAKAVGLPSFQGVTKEALLRTVCRAWQVGGEGGGGGSGEKASNLALVARLKELKQPVLGAVLTNDEDSAWPAAVALAAGRGQPLFFQSGKTVIDHSISPDEADAICRRLEGELESLGLTWRGLGEGVDTVTLCSNLPSRIDASKGTGPGMGKGASVATTDRIGRLGSGLTARERWAWCSQIFGSPARSAYQAMCGLFLVPRSAWIFDGYGDEKGFKEFDGTAAGKAFEGAGVKVEVNDAPKQSLHDWRLRAARALDADLILVNTSGEPDRFGLRPGDGRPGDIPVLRSPAMVYFVHSFSAAVPGNRDLIVGRWLERGAFLYCGSVHEPYLQAFVPTPLVVRRLRTAGPWGAIGRLDDSPLWKIAMFGDPLWVAGPARPLGKDAVALPELKDVTVELAAAVKAEKFADAVACLTLLGRDQDAAELVRVLLAQKPEAVTADVAAAGIMPMFRAGGGDVTSLFAVAARLEGSRGNTPALRDALWLAAYPMLQSPDKVKGPAMFEVLRKHVRPERPGRDAGELARAMNRTVGGGDELLKQARRSLANPGQAEEFDRDVKSAGN
jgi:hypothetical protein